MKIYIVCGTRGEYSDRQEWIVKAFIDEVRAKQFVNDANAHSRENEKIWDDRYNSANRNYDPIENPYDSLGSYEGYNAPSYYLQESYLDDMWIIHEKG